MHIFLRSLFLFLIKTCINSVFTQKDDKKEESNWDVSNPYPKDWSFKTVNLETNDGTWMNLDVSPDGKSIVFDLLGAISQFLNESVEKINFYWENNKYNSTFNGMKVPKALCSQIVFAMGPAIKFLNIT